MGLPSKSEIQEEATRRFMTRQHLAGIPDLNPERMELQEENLLLEAQQGLMAADAQVRAEQEKYLRNMASEMGFSLFTKQELAQRARSVAWMGRALQKRKPIVIAKHLVLKRHAPIPKPKPKHYVARANAFRMPNPSTITRQIKRDGNIIKSFVFGEDVWKVRRHR